MKKLCLTLGIFFFAMPAFVQTTYYNNSYQVEAYDENGRAMTSASKKPIAGSPFLNDDWAIGNVLLGKQRMLRQVPLKFDLVNHILYFRKDTLTMTFMEPVQEFSMAFDLGGIQHLVFFRNGYPKTGSRSSNTFYQLLADGSSLQFVKFYSRVVHEEYNYGRTSNLSYRDIEEYYLYEPQSKDFIKCKLNRNSLTRALPAYGEKIRQFTDEKNSQLNTEKEVVELVRYLNG